MLSFTLTPCDTETYQISIYSKFDFLTEFLYVLQPLATAIVRSAPDQVTFTWDGGSYAIYHVVDDPYFDGGTQIAADVGSNWSDLECSRETQPRTYIIRRQAAGEFDFPIVSGA